MIEYLTYGLAASTVGFGVLWALASERAQTAEADARIKNRSIIFLNKMLDDQGDKLSDAHAKLEVIHAQRVKASQAAAIKNRERAATRRAVEAVEAKACAARTMEALRASPPRPREVVVAGVGEARRMKRTSATA